MTKHFQAHEGLFSVCFVFGLHKIPPERLPFAPCIIIRTISYTQQITLLELWCVTEMGLYLEVLTER